MDGNCTTNDAHDKRLHSQVTSEKESALRRYQRVIVGSTDLSYTLMYEVILGIGRSLPGALGLAFRQKLYPKLFARTGKQVFFGDGLILRHPGKVTLGQKVIISDGCIIDARSDFDLGISIGDNVTIGDRAVLRCKGGHIRIGNNVGLGLNAGLATSGKNVVTIEDHVAIGPYAVIGTMSYHFDRLDIPITQQGQNLKGGVKVREGAWIGARAVILDGVTIGRGAIVGTSAVVTTEVADYAVVAGIPARVIRYRNDQAVVRENAAACL